MSLFAGKAVNSSNGPASPVDWSSFKQEVVSRLDVAAEFAAMGVRFTASHADAKGRRECHAIGRPDESPSAFVNVATGVYHDSGGQGESLHLFQFAVTHGTFGRWIDAVRHFAGKAGVDLGKVESKSNGRTLEATFDYRDEAGEVRYRVFRYVLPNGKKGFSQHPPDGKGGWKFGAGCMDGVEPLPYRLPGLLEADPEDAVYVVEGEKCADRLWREGLVATTSHGGGGFAKAAWPKIARWLSGRDCVVLPDNDGQGRAYANEACKALAGVARSLKRIELPDLAAKGDVVDWLAEGGSVEALGKLVHAAPGWEPGGEDKPEDDPTTRDATVADLRHSLSAEAWLWPNWIPNGALTLLASDPGVGKTRFCFDLHRRLYNGFPWPDGTFPANAVDQPRFLWVVADDQYREMCEIPEQFGIPDDCIFVNAMASDPFGGTTLQTTEELADLEARIVRVRPTLVIIDTITNTSDAKSQDSSDAKKQYKPLQGIATRCQVPILCVTHLNTSGKVLGRRAVEKVRVVIQLEQPDPEGQEHRRKLWVSKTKALKPPSLGITMGTGGNEYDTSPPEKPDEADGGRPRTRKDPPISPKLQECMDWLSTQVGPTPVRVSIIRTNAEAKGYSTDLLYKARDKLGIVPSDSDLKGRNGQFYQLWTAPPDPQRN